MLHSKYNNFVDSPVVNVLFSYNLIIISFAGLWKKALKAVEDNEDIRGKVKITTTVYSSFQLPSTISSFDDYIKVVKDFPTIIPTTAQPLYMTLEPLSKLDEDFDTVQGN